MRITHWRFGHVQVVRNNSTEKTELAALMLTRTAYFFVVQNFAGGVVAGCAHHSAARMRAGAAHIKCADGSAVVCPAWNGTQEEKLAEAHFAVENISAGESVNFFEVERRENLSVTHQTL